MTEIKNMSARRAAFDILYSWYKNKAYINKLLLGSSKVTGLSEKDTALCSRICMGVVERKPELDYIISRLSSVGLNKLKLQILILLEMGIYQLKYMSRTADYAICNEMTGIAKKIGLAKLSGFVNANLRAYISQRDEISFKYSRYFTSAADLKDIEKDELLDAAALYYSMPPWLCRHFFKELGAEKSISAFKYFLEQKSTSVRRIISKSDREYFENRLDEAGIKYEDLPYPDYAYRIENAGELLKTGLVSEGCAQIQGFSSILVGEVAAPRHDMQVLDICAAPGGKSLHIADIMKHQAMQIGQAPSGSILSCDIRGFGLNMLKERSKASGFDNIEIREQDATVLYDELKDSFDLVICDLPCSGLGVIGEKPDIKYYITEKDIDSLSELQIRILKNAVAYLKCGGTLIYSTCTVSHKENYEISDKLMSIFGLKPIDITARLPKAISGNMNESFRIQLYPGEYGSDGFFISAFCK